MGSSTTRWRLYATVRAESPLWRYALIGSSLLGRQDATLSLLHADDAARAVAAAVDANITGTHHVVGEERVTFTEYLSTFADRLAADDPSRIPGWLSRFFVGKDTVRLLTNSMPTTNTRVKQTTS